MVKLALSSLALAVLCVTAPLASAAPCDHPFRTSSVHRCTFADFDGDGRVDVASFGTSAERVTPLSVSLSRSEQTANRALPQSAAAIRVFDVDGDHDVDLVVSAADRRIVQVLLNSGYGSFEDDPLNRLVGDRDDDPASLQTPVEDEIDSAAALSGGTSVDSTGQVTAHSISPVRRGPTLEQLCPRVQPLCGPSQTRAP